MQQDLDPVACQPDLAERNLRSLSILTGGGDVPGLNSVIKSVVYRATDMGYEAIGLRRGWEGLTHVRPGADDDANYVRRLDRSIIHRRAAPIAPGLLHRLPPDALLTFDAPSANRDFARERSLL